MKKNNKLDKNIKNIIIAGIISIIIYNIVPIMNLMFPEELATFIFLIDIIVVNLVYVVIMNLIYGIKNGFKISIPLVTSLTFIPTMFIFYSSKAYLYLLIYLGFGIISNIIGNVFNRRKE